jgi:hypothetical protein
MDPSYCTTPFHRVYRFFPILSLPLSLAAFMSSMCILLFCSLPLLINSSAGSSRRTRANPSPNPVQELAQNESLPPPEAAQARGGRGVRGRGRGQGPGRGGRKVCDSIVVIDLVLDISAENRRNTSFYSLG